MGCERSRWTSNPSFFAETEKEAEKAEPQTLTVNQKGCLLLELAMWYIVVPVSLLE